MAKTPRKITPVKKGGNKALKKTSLKKAVSRRGGRGSSLLTKKKAGTTRKNKPSAAPRISPKKKVRKSKVPPLKKKLPAPSKAKTAVTADARPVQLFADAIDVPQRYNQTGVTLIARDPHWIYAYWEITPASLTAIKRKIGAPFKKSVYALRMHYVTGVESARSNAGQWFDIDVLPSVQSWYVQVRCDNASYRADLGLRTPQGRFYPMANSNVISTPSANASESSPITWMKVKHAKGAPLKIIAQISEPPSCASMDTPETNASGIPISHAREIKGVAPLSFVESNGHASLQENKWQFPDHASEMSWGGSSEQLPQGSASAPVSSSITFFQ